MDSDHNADTGAASSSSQGYNTGPVLAGEVTPGSFLPDPSSSLDPVQDFAVFMQSIGLAPDWGTLDFFDIDPSFQQADVGSQQLAEVQVVAPRDIVNRPERHNPSFRQPGSSRQIPSTGSTLGQRLESLPPSSESSVMTGTAEPEQDVTPSPWKLTEKQWQTLAERVTEYQESLYNFTLPSRHAMSRYFESYVDRFHIHYPMIHLPTYRPESAPLWLTLAIAAVGARYRLESKNGHSLYEAAMALTLDQRRLDSIHQSHETSEEGRTAMIQTLVLLMGFGAWDRNTELLGGALDLQSVLSGYIRSSLRDEPLNDISNSQWNGWVRVEMHRRTILIAFAYLVIQSTAYDLPPVVLSNEIQGLELPCPSAAWEARNETEWRSVLRQSHHTPIRAIDVLRHLLGNVVGTEDAMLGLSAIGCFIMLQALIQRIFLARQLNSTSSAALPPTELETLQ